MIVRRHNPARLRGVGAWLDAAYCESRWSLLDPLAYVGCLPRDAVNIITGTKPSDYKPLPTPPAPTVTLATGAGAADQPGAVYAGESSGQPVYAIPETAGENMARFKSAVDQYMDEQGALTPPSEDLFSKYGTALAIGGAVVGALVLLNVTRGGGR